MPNIDIQNHTHGPVAFHIPVESICPPFLRGVARLICRPLERLIGLTGANALYVTVDRLPREGTFASRVLHAMNVRVNATPAPTERIPHDGPVVIVANHPFGGIEGVILLELVRHVRSDVKALANFLLGAIPDMRDDFIFVDPFASASSARANMRPLKESLQWLSDGHVLIVFPAGEVATRRTPFSPVRDAPWNTAVARMIRRTHATVVPVHFSGDNGMLFHALGWIHPRLRTLLLPRQFVNKHNRVFPVAIGAPISATHWQSYASDDTQLLRYFRLHMCVLGSTRTRTIHPTDGADIIPPVDPAALCADVDALPTEALLATSGVFRVYVAPAARLPNVLREIGRLREETFRAAGEGTGKAIDQDAFDTTYHHLFLWHTERHEIIGAYRLGLTDEIIPTRGVKGLYTRTLFAFDTQLFAKLPHAVEMGRSFVRLEYQRQYSSLHLLWKGVSIFIARHPHYRFLFGPVSIAADYSLAARDIMVQTLRQTNFNTELSHLVRPLLPWHTARDAEWNDPNYAIFLNDLSIVQSLIVATDLEGRGLPVLLRQYIKLKGRILGFNSDPAFGSVLDGLIVVDLAALDFQTLKRYMGDEDARAFLGTQGVRIEEISKC